jgi:putative acyl-CoA dehydrogenase
MEYEAAVVLAMRVARALARLGIALAKYWLTKRCPNFIYERLECHGGVGYVEETPMPRLFREAPLNAIWEGSGSVIALDVLRTLQREPTAIDAYLTEVRQAKGANPGLDRAVLELGSHARKPIDEAQARSLCERMALVLQGSLLVRYGPRSVADAFCARHFGEGRGFTYGTLPPGVDVKLIVQRQLAEA